MAKELEKILQLFPELSEAEKQERVDIRLMRDSDIEDDKKSILQMILILYLISDIINKSI